MSREALRYLENKINNIVSRAIVKAISQDRGKIFAQVKSKDGTISDVEVLFPFGFKSLPKPGSRGVMHAYSGARDNATITDIDDKRFGQFDLLEGDSIVYNSDGSRTMYIGDSIITTADGKFEVNIGNKQILVDSSGIKLTVGSAIYDFTESKATFNKPLEVTGDIDSTGTVTGTVDVVAGGKALAVHDHPIVGGSSAPGPTGPNN